MLGRDPTILKKKPQQSNDEYVQALGDSRKKTLLFTKKKNLLEPGSGKAIHLPCLHTVV